jgi:hypothetical protein
MAILKTYARRLPLAASQNLNDYRCIKIDARFVVEHGTTGPGCVRDVLRSATGKQASQIDFSMVLNLENSGNLWPSVV